VVTDVLFSIEDAFWAEQQTWSDFFLVNTSAKDWGVLMNVPVFDTGGNPRNVSDVGTFTMEGTILTWTPIPEPSTILAGLLLMAGLFRRQR